MNSQEVKELLKLLGIEKTRRKIPSKRRQIIYKRDDGKCRYCHKDVEYKNAHLDHILPRSLWGNDYVFNLALSCPSCNMRKGANKNIVPKQHNLTKKIYELYLIYKFQDYPELQDFI